MNSNSVSLEKPKFLSKAERTALALEKRAAEIAAQKELQQKQKEENIQFIKKAEQADRNRGSGGRRRHNDDREDKTGYVSEKYKKELLIEKVKNGDYSTKEIEISEKEKQGIRDRYMGTQNKVRKVRKMNDKKFVFDWAVSEDTSTNDNPLYTNKSHLHLLGRGHIAGIDLQEQSKKVGSFYDELLKGRRTDDQKDRQKELESLSLKKSEKKAFDERNWRDKPLNEMKDRDWRIFKEDFSIATTGGSIPHPIRKWSESNIGEEILEIIEKIGYVEPSPIQRQAIPIGLQKRDIIGVAETGSGKTAAFLIPMLEYILELPPLTDDNMAEGPYAIILAPSRELALQIEQEAKKFCGPLGFNCVSIVGGHSLTQQSFSMRLGAHVIIATPGRLKDVLERHMIVLNQCTYVVMDEADRMIDMGFEADVNMILDSLPVSNLKPDLEGVEDLYTWKQLNGGESAHVKYRQTVMFSATMPVAVERLAKKYLRRPAIVTIGQAGQAVDRIEQIVEFIGDDPNRKKNRLIEILEKFPAPIIIFVNQKKGVDVLSRGLEKKGYKTTTLHGGKSQEQREYSLSCIKDGSKDILVATDVAGRGIDVKNVSVVVNYDMANSIEDYTHRIGRTGRAGQKGVAITFLSNADSEVFYDLKQTLTKSMSVVPPELSNHEASFTKPGEPVKGKKRKVEETLYSI